MPRRAWATMLRKGAIKVHHSTSTDSNSSCHIACKVCDTCQRLIKNKEHNFQKLQNCKLRARLIMQAHISLYILLRHLIQCATSWDNSNMKQLQSHSELVRITPKTHSVRCFLGEFEGAASVPESAATALAAAASLLSRFKPFIFANAISPTSCFGM